MLYAYRLSVLVRIGYISFVGGIFFHLYISLKEEIQEEES